MNISLVKRDVASKNKWERIWLLAKIEFKLRYNENKLGLLWALIKPLFQLTIYYVAFKIIMRNNLPNFAIYLNYCFSSYFSDRVKQCKNEKKSY